MKIYDQYTKARNAAWKTLIKFNLINFSINLNSLCKDLKIKLLSFSEAKKHFEINSHEEAFSFKTEKQTYIVFKPCDYKPHLRFLIAHEIGHIVLKHKGLENSFTNSEANIFARDILMPAIICHYEKLIIWQQLSKFFGVSKQAAEIRIERIAEILTPRNKWLTSHLERKYFKLYSAAHPKQQQPSQDFEKPF